MLVLSITIFGLLGQALGQTITDSAPAAATTLAGACTDNPDLLACFPASSTVCLGNGVSDFAGGINCACDHAKLSSGAYGESILSIFSAESSALCSGGGTLIPSGSFPTGVATTTLSSNPTAGAGPVATPGTGTGAGVASTATGAATSATSKAAAERGMGHVVPALGGLLGALFGAVGVFL